MGLNSEIQSEIQSEGERQHGTPEKPLFDSPQANH
jgi:hypothetical protein